MPPKEPGNGHPVIGKGLPGEEWRSICSAAPPTLSDPTTGCPPPRRWWRMPATHAWRSRKPCAHTYIPARTGVLKSASRSCPGRSSDGTPSFDNDHVSGNTEGASGCQPHCINAFRHRSETNAARSGPLHGCLATAMPDIVSSSSTRVSVLRRQHRARSPPRCSVHSTEQDEDCPIDETPGERLLTSSKEPSGVMSDSVGGWYVVPAPAAISTGKTGANSVYRRSGRRRRSSRRPVSGPRSFRLQAEG